MVRAKQLLRSGYSVAVLATLLALLLRFSLAPLLRENAPLLVFVLPVMFSAWYGGLGAGLFATGLCTLVGTYFFIPPYFSVQITDIVNLTRISIFIFEGLFISWLSESLRSARQRAEKAVLTLRDSEEKYRLLVEAVQDYAIFGLDVNGCITTWNSGAELIKGYKTAEILGRHFSIFYTEAEIAQNKPAEALQVATVTGRYTNEGWRRRKDGSLFWANVVMTALYNENQQLYGFSKVTRDITERRRSEQALQESYSLLERVIEGTADAVFVKDLQGRYQLLNSAAAHIFNRPKEEIPGKTDTELVPWEQAIALQRIDQAVIETGFSQTLEEPVSTAAGEVRIFLTSKDPYRDAAGNILGVIGVARDITERIQADAKLRRSVQRLEAVHQIDQAILSLASPEGIAELALSRLAEVVPCDQSAVILFDLEANQLQILAGTLAHDLAGTILPIGDRLPKEMLQKREPLWYVPDLANFPQRPTGFEIMLAAGYHSFLSATLSIESDLIGDLVLIAKSPDAFSSEDQEIAQEVAAQLAIAVQQVRLREQLQSYANELEQRVAERTTALQEAIDGLEIFSYSVSHDLRSPLRSMQGLSQALLEDYSDRLDETGKLYAQEISASAQQADQLVSDLLDYGRLSRAEIVNQPLNLTELVSTVLQQMQSDLQARQAVVTVDTPLPEVMGHRLTLIQALVNLLNNAVKFVPQDRQPQVHVWAELRSGWVRLWIEDNGIGIAPEYHELIFQAFERLHTRQAYPGTGVGLAIVRKGAERMGGRVGVESALGQGSRFWLELRAVEPEAIAES